MKHGHIAHIVAGAVFVAAAVIVPVSNASAADAWYTEGNFIPDMRIEVRLTNPLGIEQKNCPVTILREDLPYRNIAYEYITVVDPALPPRPKPTIEELTEKGAEAIIHEEANGGHVIYQQDDLDRDGLWDELFFMVDIGPKETKTIWLYIGFTERGLFEHRTHAALGWYARHPMPFWESEYIGWKLFYPTDVDMHGKRQPMLTAYPEYQRNLGGYYMPREYGTDIMAVGRTFGAGGICLFEHPAVPDSVSRPRFSPSEGKGPIYDTRYSFEVIANGPLRSMMRINTMNWNTGSGIYELSQTYTAYAGKSYSTCRVEYSAFAPERGDVAFGCGMRKVMGEYATHRGDGLIVSFGKDFDPFPPLTFSNSTVVKYQNFKVGFEGIALAVRSEYSPEYVDIPGFGGNHAFRIPVNERRSYEYMIMGGWNEGAVNNTEDAFRDYAVTEALKYNNRPVIRIGALERKQ